MERIESLLQVTNDEKEKVRELYGKTNASIQEDMDILKEWMKKQPHLPAFKDDTRLESILLRNKFKIEKTKLKIDKYFSLKGLYPEFFENCDIESKPLRLLRRATVNEPMPRLTDKLERVIVFKVCDPEMEFNFLDLGTHVIIMQELSMSHDYCVGERLVFDWEGFTLSHFLKIDPTLVMKAMKLHQEAYSSRILGFEFLNYPSFIDLILQLIKPIFKPKIFKRIALHKDLNSLHKVIPPKYLPKDLGGSQESLCNLRDAWNEELKVQKMFLQENAKLVSNESLRIGKLYDSDMFGTEGNFKQLNID